MRTIVTIDDQEIEALSKLCQQKGWSRAKGFREGVRLLLKEFNDEPKEVDVFGIWKNRKVDGVSYQTKLREEW